MTEEIRSRLTLKVLPVRKLGVDKSFLKGEGPVAQGCKATQGGSCDVNCTIAP